MPKRTPNLVLQLSGAVTSISQDSRDPKAFNLRVEDHLSGQTILDLHLSADMLLKLLSGSGSEYVEGWVVSADRAKRLGLKQQVEQKEVPEHIVSRWAKEIDTGNVDAWASAIAEREGWDEWYFRENRSYGHKVIFYRWVEPTEEEAKEARKRVKDGY